MRRIVGLAFGGFAVFNGLKVLTADNCESISFDGQGGRVAIAQCFADNSGVLPAWLAGIGMILVGVIVGLLAIKR
jgi:hypothetical protein